MCTQVDAHTKISRRWCSIISQGDQWANLSSNVSFCIALQSNFNCNFIFKEAYGYHFELVSLLWVMSKSNHSTDRIIIQQPAVTLLHIQRQFWCLEQKISLGETCNWQLRMVLRSICGRHGIQSPAVKIWVRQGLPPMLWATVWETPVATISISCHYPPSSSTYKYKHTLWGLTLKTAVIIHAHPDTRSFPLTIRVQQQYITYAPLLR